ncbi:delta-lactam-biosynthetic de-N-acetylase [Lottiidibacillus patelloidae]|uniref:Delta-lactam-biosynthetic de-N-acetylase n=1 Tax=Lottiidibacillus patelloidae TaxID=2670334 RepID=A0A263BU19_9BACI|nr:delta-lactam-biosynthetic de-N-acetylase [Lottiidibacillus patelloidae]OZM57042.1 delta-lactam-biosynthetic de-N-acetylase [Lottiidibacillus patelloidae]
MKKLLLIGIVLLISVALPISASATQYENKPYHWGFKKSKNHQPASIAQEPFAPLIPKYESFFIGNIEEKELYLTFDNGYENGYTEKVLDVLLEKKVPAAFFVTGHYLKDQPHLVKRMVKEGHTVGNHSWHHPDLTTVSDARLKEELDKVKSEYEALTGKKDMTYLRPPRGIFSERTLALSKQLGYTNVFWSLAYKDWETDNQKGWKYAYDKIMQQVHPGAIMLLHSVSKDNAEALGKVIDDLRKQGYTFKSLDALLFDDPMQNAR